VPLSLWLSTLFTLTLLFGYFFLKIDVILEVSVDVVNFSLKIGSSFVEVLECVDLQHLVSAISHLLPFSV
jgi:hypothetical protein